MKMMLMLVCVAQNRATYQFAADARIRCDVLLEMRHTFDSVIF